jgi:hypothetical protein
MEGMKIIVGIHDGATVEGIGWCRCSLLLLILIIVVK